MYTLNLLRQEPNQIYIVMIIQELETFQIMPTQYIFRSVYGLCLDCKYEGPEGMTFFLNPTYLQPDSVNL